jgi:hypothetical protein
VKALLQAFHAKTSSPLSASAHTEIIRAYEGVAAARQFMLAQRRQGAAVLRAKSPQAEADGVTRWLMWIATSVASPAADGTVGAEPPISGAGVQALEQLAVALDAPPERSTSGHNRSHRSVFPATGVP